VEKWDEHRTMLNLGFQHKPDLKRGGKRSGFSTRYICFGKRKEPKGKDVADYAYKKTATDEIQGPINEAMANLVHDLESKSCRGAKFLPDYKDFLSLKGQHKIPAAFEFGFATQFSVGKDYWSKVHDDDDFFFTTLSALAPDSKDFDEIVHYFVFPEYRVAVPIRSGDVILFNPSVKHACANPRFEGALIFSAYVTKKTMCRQIANEVDKLS